MKLLPEQIGRIENGNTNDWDLPLLFHVLLHSSLYLLADQVPDLQVSLIPGLNTITVVPITAQSRDLTNVLKQDDKVIFNLPSDEIFRGEVINVQKNQFSIKMRFNLPSSLQGIPPQRSLIVDGIYVCTREWYAVEKLSCLHSDYFSHRKETPLSNTDFRMVVQCIEGAYDDLNVPTHHLKNIETGEFLFLMPFRQVIHTQRIYYSMQYCISLLVSGWVLGSTVLTLSHSYSAWSTLDSFVCLHSY